MALHSSPRVSRGGRTQENAGGASWVRGQLDPARQAALNAVLACSVAPRDAALLGLVLGVGLRSSQVAALDVDDVRVDGSGEVWLRISRTPTRPPRTASLAPAASRLLRAYLASVRHEDGGAGPLFFTASRHTGTARRRLSARAVECLARRCARQCGMEESLSPASTPRLIGARLPRTHAVLDRAV